MANPPADAVAAVGSAGPRRGILTAVILALILLLALALRLWGFTDQGLWFDEANGVLFADRPLAELPGLLGEDSSPPLYYVLLHGWMRLFGMGEEAVRSLSLLLGLGTVLLTFLLGRELLGREAGLWGAFWVAASPIAVFHAQQARMYTLLPLTGAAALLFLVRHLRRGRLLDLAGAALFAALALYTHNFAFHLLPVLGLLALAAGGWRRGRLLPLLAAGAALGLAYLPWLPVFLRQLNAHHQYAWFAEATGGWGWPRHLWYCLRSFSPGGEGSMFGGHRTDLWGGWPAAAAVLLAGIGAAWLFRRRRRLHPVQVWALPLAVAAPLASALAASLFAPAHLVPGRVDQLMLPAFALLAGLGLTLLPPPARWLKIPAAAAILGLACWTIPRLNPEPAEYQFAGGDREATAAIAKRLRPGDVILCSGWSSEPIRYYLRLQGLEPPIMSFLGFLPELGLRQAQGDGAFLVGWVERIQQGLRNRLGPGGRIFLVAVEDPMSQDVLRSLFEQLPLRLVLDLGKYLQIGFARAMPVGLYELD